MFNSFFLGKRVLLTGHTGFKGAWLSEWLLQLGAEVHGYALDPHPHEVLFDQLSLHSRIASDTRADLADESALQRVVQTIKPDVVFHLAAQPLVRLSYEIPIQTFATNVMGTAHVLEAIRLNLPNPCAVVCVTTDKCYENREWLHGYRESDPMGGRDPYSASKGAAELVIASYRNSFFSSNVQLASARAGNVIGGGDWAADRIVPDCIRALLAQQAIPIRNRTATRPWQHVLEPLSGYLWLAVLLSTVASPSDRSVLASAFNFGPEISSNRTVADLVSAILSHWPGQWENRCDPNAPHEASKLNLATDKAFHLLDWKPVWNFSKTICKTVEWYRKTDEGCSPRDLTGDHIISYQRDAAAQGLAWACPSVPLS